MNRHTTQRAGVRAGALRHKPGGVTPCWGCRKIPATGPNRLEANVPLRCQEGAQRPDQRLLQIISER